MTVHFDTLQDLRPFLLRGLLHRAVERRFHEIPALVVQCWIAQGSHADISYDPEDVLTKLLQEYAAFFAHVWYYILHTLDEGTHHFIYLVDPLAKSCTDRIFDILPLTSEGLTRSQVSFITGVLQRYFWHERTAERLAYFQRVAPAFTQQFQLPSRPKPPHARDLLYERQQLVEALHRGQDPIAQTANVLLTIAEIEQGVRRRHEVTEDAVSHVLARTPPVVKQQIMQAFRACVTQLHYRHQSTGSQQFSITSPDLVIPFWVLRHSGESFPLSKVAEIACCYYDIHRDDARYEALLEELRYQDRILWRQSMLQMLEGGLAALDHPLRYLSRIQDDVYLAQCCERLERGDFKWHHLWRAP